MLKLTDVSLRRGRKLLFENVTFQAHAGQRIGVIGANGSGKTSLFQLLLGELEADAGTVHIPRGSRLGHVSQESPAGPHTALDHVLDGDRELRRLQSAIRRAEHGAVETEVPDDLYGRFEEIDGFSAESRGARLLHGLGFQPDEYSRPVDAFSGGWKMRLNLAQALMCRSDLLLLDEPTNHLDLPAILWLESWLRHYRGILLLVSHDRDFLDATCTRIANLEHGAITLYEGDYSRFESVRAEALARQQAMYRRQQKEIRHIQAYVDRFRYKASKARQAQSRLKMLERMTHIAPAHVDSPFRFRFLEPERQPQHLVRIEAGAAGYTQTVLRDIELQISSGDRIGLLGVNGAGKSTLVKALADGSTLLAGERRVSRDTRIGYFAQHQLERLDPDRSPLDHLRTVAPGDRESELRRYLGGFGFQGDRIFEPVAPFSGGEKARLVLALVIRERPNLLLLDEPTNHLDLEMRQALGRALTGYDGAIVVISHDRHLLRSVCDELLLVHDGTVQRFERSLDDYTQWLDERSAEQPDGSATTDSAPRGNRRHQRQREARRRQQLKPLTDRVRQLESRLSECRERWEALGRKLAEPDLYTDDSRKSELTSLIRDEAELKASIEELETLWLDASEDLERAQSPEAS
ncbi:MAG: ATP-binding cassette domain-containing protein [Xanthomonadales bacterium]|nr:ATP-binding cassette domain-containing protein [Xanthomonadales bacterium]